MVTPKRAFYLTCNALLAGKQSATTQRCFPTQLSLATLVNSLTMTAMDSKMSPDFLPITTSVTTAGKVMASTTTKTGAFLEGSMSFPCTKTFIWMVLLSSSVLTLTPSSYAAPAAVIHGNANGLWSPTHPHLTGGKSSPPAHSAAYLASPAHIKQAEPETQPELEVSEISDICPTLQSAPHLCQ